MSEPMRPGRATSWKSWSVLYGNPACGSLVATMLQISQIEKPRCSARIDQKRFRLAMNFPFDSQNCSSSGFQSEIQVDRGSAIGRPPDRKWRCRAFDSVIACRRDVPSVGVAGRFASNTDATPSAETKSATTDL